MKQYISIALIMLLAACHKGVYTTDDEHPALFPDYADATVPINIAPLCFSVHTNLKAYASFRFQDFAFEVASNRRGEFIIPTARWTQLLQLAKGDQAEVAVAVVKDGVRQPVRSFGIHVAREPVDPYIAYRLIEPGYALWNKMGIYQRRLSDFTESAVYENKMTGYNCVNCHSFCRQQPDKMLFHLRAKHAGTVMIDGDDVDILQTKTEQTISALVYPSWHPSGRFVAFSVNRTTQEIHPTQRTEVFDLASDVVVYDVETQTILTTPSIFSKNVFETFPTFSPDGRTLYFCAAPACAVPDSIQDLRYSLCSIDFDPDAKSFGRQVDTLYNAESHRQSVSFPRVSPDGRFLMCTLSSYGTFSIWHKDADLYLIDLETRTGQYPAQVNSDQAESYHSWSSNSRWVVFSSRRLDGLYTRPFIVYIDANGEAAKPFLLPQKKIATYYTDLMQSYNIPEFVAGKIPNRSYAIMKKAKKPATHQQVLFSK